MNNNMTRQRADGGVRMSIQMDFTGKRVWVTGAARGIGEQIARHF